MKRITVPALALGAVIAGITAAMLVATDRPHETAAQVRRTPRAAPADLTSSLRRCVAIDRDDTETAFCMAVWEENRRRFFGKPAQPLRQPPAIQPEGTVP